MDAYATNGCDNVTLLLRLIEQLLPIRFIAGPSNEGGAVLALEVPRDRPRSTPQATGPSLTVSSNPISDQASSVRSQIVFADSALVPEPFRARTVVTAIPHVVRPLTVREDEAVLARTAHGALWTVTRWGESNRFRSALPMPRVTDGTAFADLFGGDRFMEFLPLLHFLRQITDHRTADLPALRATFIIDDPNLHGMRYGYVDYRQVLAGAKKNNYHVAFATIPLDAWLTSAHAAQLFHDNPNWISVLVHGNNHGRDELAQPQANADCAATLRQALARIERLERTAHIEVARVMVPPHGAFNRQTLSLLPSCGFEAACVSTGSLRFHNKGVPWTRTLGFHPCELVEGCPVLPRWGLTGEVTNALLVAAFLGQPLVIRGHHHDFKDGSARFDEIAAFINGLGDVRWSDTTRLARSNYMSKSERGTCHLTPLALRLEFQASADVRELQINTGDDDGATSWRVALPRHPVQMVSPGQPITLDDKQRSPITIFRESTMRETRTSSKAAVRPALVLRRLLTEARDRLLAT